ncbi:DAB1 [Scenedesmus sp. PABB004]|nr:DAB1 [Scenedesmus sp. PABB004]
MALACAADRAPLCARRRPPAARRRQRCSLAAPRGHRCLRVVATSEFWYEEEEEFDALTEVLPPKRVHVATPAAARAAAAELRAGAQLVAAFASPALVDAGDAARVWEELGRAGPPLFIKVRAREALGAADAAEPGAAAAFWAELAGQSWRTALDAGLPGAADAAGAAEEVLVLLGTQAGVRALLAGAAGAGAAETWPGGGVAVVALAGWNQGAERGPLADWRSQLAPRLATALPQLFINRDAGNSCTAQPSRAYAGHGGPRADPATTISVAPLATSAPGASATNGSVLALCAGQRYELTVSFGSALANSLITASAGTLDELERSGGTTGMAARDEQCPNRYATPRITSAVRLALEVPADAAGALTIASTAARGAFDSFRSASATLPVLSGAACGAPPTGEVRALDGSSGGDAPSPQLPPSSSPAPAAGGELFAPAAAPAPRPGAAASGARELTAALLLSVAAAATAAAVAAWPRRAVAAPWGGLAAADAGDRMDELNAHQFWGVSPFLDLLGAADAAGVERSAGGAPDEPLALLQARQRRAGAAPRGRGGATPLPRPPPAAQVCPYDCRHTLATLAAACEAAAGARGAAPRRVELVVYEEQPEVLARHMLLLGVLFEPALSQRERAEVFLELHGNALLRQRTADYLGARTRSSAGAPRAGRGGPRAEPAAPAPRAAAASRRLEAAVAALPRCAPPGAAAQAGEEEGGLGVLGLFDLSQLRYAERDALLEAFQRYRAKAGFDMARAWDDRCRKWYGDRYDVRANMAFTHTAVDVAEHNLMVRPRAAPRRAWPRAGAAGGDTRAGRRRPARRVPRRRRADTPPPPPPLAAPQAFMRQLRAGCGGAEEGGSAAAGGAHRANAARGPTSMERLAEPAEHGPQDGAQPQPPPPAPAQSGEQQEQQQARGTHAAAAAAELEQVAAAEAAATAAAVSRLLGAARVRLLCGDLRKSLTGRAGHAGRFGAATLGHRHVHLLGGEHGLAPLLARGAPLLVESAANLVQLNDEQAAAFEARVVELARGGGLARHPALGCDGAAPAGAAGGRWRLPPGHFALAAAAAAAEGEPA